MQDKVNNRRYKKNEHLKKGHLFICIIQKSNIKWNIENAVFEQKIFKKCMFTKSTSNDTFFGHRALY